MTNLKIVEPVTEAEPIAAATEAPIADAIDDIKVPDNAERQHIPQSRANLHRAIKQLAVAEDRLAHGRAAVQRAGEHVEKTVAALADAQAALERERGAEGRRAAKAIEHGRAPAMSAPALRAARARVLAAEDEIAVAVAAHERLQIVGLSDRELEVSDAQQEISLAVNALLVPSAVSLVERLERLLVERTEALASLSEIWNQKHDAGFHGQPDADIPRYMEMCRQADARRAVFLDGLDEKRVEKALLGHADFLVVERTRAAWNRARAALRTNANAELPL